MKKLNSFSLSALRFIKRICKRMGVALESVEEIVERYDLDEVDTVGFLSSFNGYPIRDATTAGLLSEYRVICPEDFEEGGLFYETASA